MDETYIRVKGNWVYLYRAVDSSGATIDFLLSAKRDAAAAERFLARALGGVNHGNMIDFPLAALALYIDKAEVDRRVFHQAEVAARKNPFLERIRKNLFRSQELESLLGVLNSF